MNHLYKRTFDQVHMSEKSAADLRAELASRSAHSKTEETSMNKRHTLRRPSALLVAAILVTTMTVSALACGYIYNVIYKVDDKAEIPEDAVTTDLTDAEFETHDYNYTTDENGEIIVDLSGMDLDDGVAGDVTYEVASESDIPEDAESIDLTEQEADYELQNYSYIEENGKVIVDLDGVN